MNQLSDIQKLIIEEFEKLPFYFRAIFEKITLDNRINGIVGSRGVGKTTFLLHTAIKKGAKEGKALYVSADNLYFLENKLVDLVDQLRKQTDIRFLCIDEIHKYPNWNQELKNIYDTYLDFTILFSGSSTIDLVRSKYDLSRRVTLYDLHGFSFREYLESHLNLSLPVYSLEELLKNSVSIAQRLEVPQILKHFNDYLRVGYYPFFYGFTQDREKFQAIRNTSQKTIYEDIGTLHTLKTPTLGLIEKLFKYVLHSSPGELNASKLASHLGKDFESISKYLLWLQQAGLIRFLYSDKTGKASLRNPVKMYPENTNLLYAGYTQILEHSRVGKVRETFTVCHLQNGDYPVAYSHQGDFKVDETVFEVGGKKKSNFQIKDEKNGYVLADEIIVGTRTKIPLYLIGFLY